MLHWPCYSRPRAGPIRSQPPQFPAGAVASSHTVHHGDDARARLRISHGIVSLTTGSATRTTTRPRTAPPPRRLRLRLGRLRLRRTAATHRPTRPVQAEPTPTTHAPVPGVEAHRMRDDPTTHRTDGHQLREQEPRKRHAVANRTASRCLRFHRRLPSAARSSRIDAPNTRSRTPRIGAV